MTRNLQNILIAMFLVMIGCVAIVAHAESGRVYTESRKTASIGEEIRVKVYVDVPEPINAIDLEMAYSGSLTYVSTITSGSIVSFFHTDTDTQRKGHLTLSGGMLTPFSGTHGYVATIIFSAAAAGNASINFERGNFYRADGAATKIGSTYQESSISIEPIAEDNIPTIIQPATDRTEPILFVETMRDSANGLSLIVFSAEDTESGISQTDLRYKTWFEWGDWYQIENPAVYPSGAWQVEVQTKNGAGGTAHQIILLPGVLLFKLLITLALLAVVIFGIIKIFPRKLHKI